MPMHDEHGAALNARLVTYYGRLAAELDEATNPSQQAWLRARLAELDTTLDRATAELSPSRGEPGHDRTG